MKDLRSLFALFLVLWLILTSLMVVAYVTTIETGPDGWVTVTVKINNQVVAVRSWCTPGCVQYQLPGDGGVR